MVYHYYRPRIVQSPLKAGARFHKSFRVVCSCYLQRGYDSHTLLGVTLHPQKCTLVRFYHQIPYTARGMAQIPIRHLTRRYRHHLRTRVLQENTHTDVGSTQGLTVLASQMPSRLKIWLFNAVTYIYLLLSIHFLFEDFDSCEAF